MGEEINKAPGLALQHYVCVVGSSLTSPSDHFSFFLSFSSDTQDRITQILESCHTVIMSIPCMALSFF